MGALFWHSLPGAFLSRVGKEAKGHQRERVETLSLWTSSLNDQRRGAAGPLPLDPSPGCPIGTKEGPGAHESHSNYADKKPLPKISEEVVTKIKAWGSVFRR